MGYIRNDMVQQSTPSTDVHVNTPTEISLSQNKYASLSNLKKLTPRSISPSSPSISSITIMHIC